MINDVWQEALIEHQKVIELVKTDLKDEVYRVAEIMGKALKDGNKLFFCGNGGSAADSQHLAAEFIGRFQTERNSLPAIALTTDTSILTSIGNDYGFEYIFSRQVEGLGKKGDVFIGISTSGKSKNVLLGVEKAKNMGLTTIALTGKDGGVLKDVCDICLNVAHPNTARVQEAHIFIGYVLCELLDEIKL